MNTQTQYIKKSEISSVGYTTLTEATLERLCTIRVSEPYQYRSDTKNTPFDLRLGTIDNALLCETCGLDSNSCAGHYGYIELEHPVINPVFQQYVSDLLKCVCYECSNILISDVEQEKLFQDGGSSLNILKIKCKLVKSCFYCKEPRDSLPDLSTPQIVKIFKKITNRSMKILGFNKHSFNDANARDEKIWKDPVLDNIFHIRPESWIFEKIFPVIPPQARLYAITDGERKEDHLTNAYNNLIKITRMIRDIRDPTSHKKKTKKTEARCIADQEKFVYMIIDNKAQNKIATGERKVLSLAERMCGKDGHIQLNIAGKRVNQSARTVIDSSGYLLNANEFGVPEYIANILTVTEIITPMNIHYFNSLMVTEKLFCEDCKIRINANHVNKKKYANDIRKNNKSVFDSQIDEELFNEESKIIKESNAVASPEKLKEIDDKLFDIRNKRQERFREKRKILSEIFSSNHSNCTVSKKTERGKIVSVTRKGNIINVERATNNFTVPFAWGGTVGLQYGDCINRNIMNNDICLANRQPSIRTESVMGLTVRIHNNLVFQVPLALTLPWNADFDGDEMNIHIPQTVEAQAESKFILNASNSIISRQTNSPIIGIVQNTLVSMYLMTLSAIPFTDFNYIISYFDLDRIQNLAMRCKDLYPNYVKKVGKTWMFVSSTYDETLKTGESLSRGVISGKILASIVFPDTFFYKRKNMLSETNPYFIVENGIILPDSGPMCKKIIGITKGSCIHYLWKRPYSPEICTRFISELQIIGLHYITTRGFSFGVSDCVPIDNELYKKALFDAYEKETPEMSYEEIVEIRSEVRKIRDIAPKIVEETLNNAYIECENINASNKPEDEKEAMINSTLNKTLGSSTKLAKYFMNKGKGNSLVIMKVSGAKGTDVNNGQISGFAGQQNLDGERIKKTLHGPGGSRCLPTFEYNDNTPKARGFISNSLLTGLTPSQTYFFAQTGRQGNVETQNKVPITGYIQKKISARCCDAVQQNDGTIRDAGSNIIQFIYGNDGFNPKKLLTINYKDTEVPFFVDVQHLSNYLNSIVEKQEEIEEPKRKLFDDELNFIVNNISTLYTVNSDAVSASCKMASNILRDKLSEISIYPQKIVQLNSEITVSFKDSINETGEAVGLVAGSSIGEPTTQMSLNSHQFVGISEKEVSGITRLTELLEARIKPSNPSMSIFLSPDITKKSTEQKVVENVVKMFKLRGITFTPPDDISKLYSSKYHEIGNLCLLFLPYNGLNAEVIRIIMESLKLSGKKHIIVIYRGKITPNAKSTIAEMKKEYRIELFNETEMQYDPTEHYLVPKHVILSKEEKEKLYATYSIKTSSMLPSISCDDPIVRRIGAVKNQVVKIIRKDLIVPGEFEVFYRIVTNELVKKKK